MIAKDIPTFAVSGSRVLVTGGAGFLGSYVVERLLEEGAERVVVVDDFSLGRPNLAYVSGSWALEVIEFDCADMEGLQAVCEAESGFDACFNLAVIPLPASLEEPRRTTDANVAITTSSRNRPDWPLPAPGSVLLLRGIRDRAEAPMPEDHPLHPHTPYAASKAATDHVALSYWITFGLPTTVVRPFNASRGRTTRRTRA